MNKCRAWNDDSVESGDENYIDSMDIWDGDFFGSDE
jgi:hypothetical protein